jgi:hypothetical protein
MFDCLAPMQGRSQCPRQIVHDRTARFHRTVPAVEGDAATVRPGRRASRFIALICHCQPVCRRGHSRAQLGETIWVQSGRC